MLILARHHNKLVFKPISYEIYSYIWSRNVLLLRGGSWEFLSVLSDKLKEPTMNVDRKMEKIVVSLNHQIVYLKMESAIQTKIIQQLKTLHSTSLQKNPSYCDAGHLRCKIDHKRLMVFNIHFNICH